MEKSSQVTTKVPQNIERNDPASTQHVVKVGSHQITSTTRPPVPAFMTQASASCFSSDLHQVTGSRSYQADRRISDALPMAVPGDDTLLLIRDMLDSMGLASVVRTEGDKAGHVVFLVDAQRADVFEMVEAAHRLARCGMPAQGASLLVSLVVQGSQKSREVLLHPSTKQFLLEQIDSLLGDPPKEIVAIDKRLSRLPKEPVARERRLKRICTALTRLHHAAWDAHSMSMVNRVNSTLLAILHMHPGATAESALQECTTYRNENREKFEFEARPRPGSSPNCL